MKTLLSIGVMTVLSGAGATAWAQAPATQPAPTRAQAPTTQPAPTSQTAPSGGSAVPATAPVAGAARISANQLVELQAMDANDDDLVSRQEYMAHYERMYSNIRKDSAGMISLKDLTASTTTSQPIR